MTKREFIDRLILAAETAKRVASALEYVSEDLPNGMVFTLLEHDDGRGVGGPESAIKFLGGRLLKAIELQKLKAARAGSLLWIDGKVSAWINIAVSNCSGTATEFELMFSRTLVPADCQTLYPDINIKAGNALVPFRIRGPGERGWIEREKDA